LQSKIAGTFLWKPAFSAANPFKPVMTAAKSQLPGIAVKKLAGMFDYKSDPIFRQVLLISGLLVNFIYPVFV